MTKEKLEEMFVRAVRDVIELDRDGRKKLFRVYKLVKDENGVAYPLIEDVYAGIKQIESKRVEMKKHTDNLFRRKINWDYAAVGANALALSGLVVSAFGFPSLGQAITYGGIATSAFTYVQSWRYNAKEKKSESELKDFDKENSWALYNNPCWIYGDIHSIGKPTRVPSTFFCGD